MDGTQDLLSNRTTAPHGVAVPTVTVQDLIAAVGSIELCANGAGLIGQLSGLQHVKSAVAGLEARIAAAFDVHERRAQAESGVPASEQDQGVAAQIALARGESPSRGSRLLGLAKA